MALERFQGSLSDIVAVDGREGPGWQVVVIDVSAYSGANYDVGLHIAGPGLEIRLSKRDARQLADLLDQAIDHAD